MIWPDIVNGIFEFLAGFFILNHCRKLLKDKMVRGVSVISTGFFGAWGLWNLFYYPSLGQWWSFAGGLFIVIGHISYVSLLIYFIRREKKLQETTDQNLQ